MEKRLAILIAVAAAEFLVFRQHFLLAAFATIASAAGYYLLDYFISNDQNLLHDTVLRTIQTLYKSKIEENADLLESVVESRESAASSTPKFCKICEHSPCYLEDTDIYQMKKLSRNFRPVKVDRVIDEKLTEFLNSTIDKYIKDWYSSINDRDQLFIGDLKSHLKFSLSAFVHRLRHLDLTDLIFDRFLPPAFDFLRLYFEVEQTCKSNNVMLTDQILTKKILEIYSGNSKLHPAVYNRASEVNYLRDISQYLLEKCLNFEIDYTAPVLIILREILAVCILLPVMDILADPETLNLLLEMLFSDRKTDLSDYERSIGIEVEFLSNFASNYAESNSFIVPTLPEILNNQPLLYIFINFMKRIHGPMNFLQFLLSVHQLRSRLMSQIMEPVQKETLDMIRWEIWELYRNYLHNQSNDRICQLDDRVLKTFKNLTEGHDVEFSDIKSAINDVYEYTSQHFDRNYVSGCFATSEEYLQYLCGTFCYADDPEDDHNDKNVVDPDSVEIFRKTVKNVLQSRSSMRSCDSPHLSSKSSRRESASDQEFPGPSFNCDISTTTPEKNLGTLLDLSSCPGSVFESASTMTTIFTEDVINDNILMNECPDFGAAVKDLSRWTVDISCVEPRRDLQGGKTIYVYVVSVSRKDVLSAHPCNHLVRAHSSCSDGSGGMDSGSESNYGPTQSWKIDRKYHEFYVLEAKLVEFHTDTILDEQPLPPKKMFNVKSRAFVESMRPDFDRFLKRLLKNKRLKHSELLYTFLTSTDELTLSFLPNPFQLVKNIPNRFVLERGQNLALFLDAFQQCSTKNNSLMTSKSTSKLTYSDSCTVSPTDMQCVYKTTLYENNFNLSNKFYNRRRRSTNFGIKSMDYSERCLDMLLLITRQILELPYFIYTLIITALYPYRLKLWTVFRRFSKKQLNPTLNAPRIAYLIELLTNRIYKNQLEPSFSSKERTLETFRLFIDRNLQTNSSIRDKLWNGYGKLLSCVQYPITNKHLSYILLDIALCELFPELRREKVL